ncbi:MAG: 3-phosphoshikimate 1-carboxyvinyltransferase [Actinomycetota bacterium]|nr:3-phosphoshikimate 1-carboxyvinyltransferase [Actinomycetota bacterium]
MPEPLPIEPLASPPDATVVLPGSKSITNRALVCAFLAEGVSRLEGVLFSDDTEAMLGVIETLGALVEVDRPARRVAVGGRGGAIRPGPVTVDVRQSGTTSRFVTPLVARGEGLYTVDGAPQMRARPMGPQLAALRALGVDVHGDTLPIAVRGGIRGGSVTIGGDVSSQFASGLLLASPGLAEGLDLWLTGDAVSLSYLALTTAVMAGFGVEVDTDDERRWTVAADARYRPSDHRIEPDATAASYFLAAAALTGGRVRIEGLGSTSRQGDVAFAEVLAAMGAQVTIDPDAIEVRGTGTLRGIDVDMSDISDTAQTLAAIAPFADGPTRVSGIGFIRRKETDRIGAVVTELRRLGIEANEEPDGFLVEPGAPLPGTVETYDDHRMAMSFALVGLVAEGIAIADPGCVAKTFPDYFEALDTLRT